MYDFPVHDYTQEQNGNPYFSSVVQKCKWTSLSTKTVKIQKFPIMETWRHTCLYSSGYNIVTEKHAQAPVVQQVENAMHRINHYPVDSAIGFPNTCLVDSDLSGG